MSPLGVARQPIEIIRGEACLTLPPPLNGYDIIAEHLVRRGEQVSARYPGKYLIGLTGNIAVGKSRVRELLSELGAAAIDADHIAHEVLAKGDATYDAVVAAFGAGILNHDGEIERRSLGAIVFADPARLKQLENITHPAIRARIDQWIREAEERIVVVEAIKLLEGELKRAVDSIWVVDAAPETQLRRLMKERRLSEAEAQRRIDLQNSQADKLRQADLIISNDGDIADTRAQVTRAWHAIPTGSRQL